MFLNSTRGLRGRAGFANVGVRSFGEQPYLTVAQTLRRVVLLTGWTRDSGHDRLMLGLDGKVSARWSAVTDWIAGSGNFASVGARYHFSGERTLTMGYLRPNSREDGDGVYLSYGCSWSARGKNTEREAVQGSEGTAGAVSEAGTCAAASSRSSALK
jgi:hypothetical protein